MKRPADFGLVFPGAVLAMLSGCAGMQSTAPVSNPAPQSTGVPAAYRGVHPGRAVSPAAVRGPLIYVADQRSREIVIFPEKGRLQPPIGTITDGIVNPYGLYVDKHGTLYVANQFGNVVAYPKGSTSPSATYTQGLGRPLYPIVDSHGNLFVGDGHNGTVVEYLASGTNEYQILSTPGNEADDLAFDPAGTLYVAYRGADAYGSIETFGVGSSQGQVLGMTLNQPQGLAVDSHFNVLAVETGDARRIDVFPPGMTTPSTEVQMPPGDVPTQISLENNERTLLVSTLRGVIYEIPYPLPNQPSPKEKLKRLVQGVAASNDQL